MPPRPTHTRNPAPTPIPTPTRTPTPALALAFLLLLSLPLQAQPRDPSWESVLTGREGITAADGGASLLLPNNRVLWLLADSVIGRTEDGRHTPGAAIVNNTIIVHPLGEPPDRPPAPDSIQKLWGPAPKPGAHSAWLMPDGQTEATPDAKSWYWPTGGAILLDTRLFLFYTRMARAGGEAKGTVWDFRAMNSTLAAIDNPDADPAAWRPTIHDLGPIEQGGSGGRRINWGVAAVQSEGFVHIVGIDDTMNLNKRAMLARVEPGQIADAAHWRFWTGVEWVAARSEAAAVCEAATDELSIHRETGAGEGGRWVMIHMEPNLGRRIMLRTADQLTGPWSDPRVIYECPEPPTDKRLMVYAARAHPELSTPDELLITYAVNSTDFWHMLSNAELYRLRVLRLPRSALRLP